MIGLTKLVALATIATIFSAGAIVGAAMVRDDALASDNADAGELDYGLDTNNNGLYDFLVVNIPYAPEDAGYYSVHAQLYAKTLHQTDCDGDIFLPRPEQMDYPISYAYVRVFLEQTDDTIKIAFDGKDIYKAGVDGPYKVLAYIYGDWDYWYFREPMPYPGPGNNDGLLPPEPWEYTTSDYEFSEFEQPRLAIRFTGSNSDQGVDINENGLYDFLRVTSEVEVSLEGDYSVSASIIFPWDETWLEPRNLRPYPIAYYYGFVTLEEGVQTIDFDIPGHQIRSSEVDGPYDIYLTASYIGGIGINWTDPGLPPLPPQSWRPDGMGWNEPLPPNEHFDYYYDSACHTSQAYSHDQFDEPLPDVAFTGEFADYGVDWNGNDLYEELVVEAGVEVYQPGYFEITGTLSAGDGRSVITYYYDRQYLSSGVQTILLRFMGYDIERSGQDGPYDVHISIMRVERPIDPETDYTTSYYSHDDFEAYSGGNRTRNYWIEAVEIDVLGEPPAMFGGAAVTIRRGPDLLPYVVEDIAYMTIDDSTGNRVFEGEASFTIITGGQSTTVYFRFELPEHGDYTATVYLTSMEFPTDIMQLTFSA